MAGEAAALAPIADAIQDALDEDERQFGLFGEPATEAGRAKLAAVVRQGPGRPAGSRNKRTEATVAALLQRYRDPRAVALERIQMHPADLAAVLDCTVFEASQEQRLYLTAILPFMHARITPEVVDNRQVIHLTIGALGEAGSAAAGGVVQLLDAAAYEVIESERPASGEGDRDDAE